MGHRTSLSLNSISLLSTSWFASTRLSLLWTSQKVVRYYVVTVSLEQHSDLLLEFRLWRLSSNLYTMSDKSSCWKLDYDEIRKTLVNVAKDAGQMITSARPSTTALGTKKNSVDLVTETDQAVEAMISKTLGSKYPTFKFMGEETYKPGTKLDDAPTFICDPIDGTTNFVHGYPYVSISLGFAVRREPVVGVIYKPFHEGAIPWYQGQGFFCRIRGRHHQQATLARRPRAIDNTQLCPDCDRMGQRSRRKHLGNQSQNLDNLGKSKDEGGAMAHSLRSFGSAALNLCGVAAGGLDLYWEGGCWAWDVCAGMVILKEAGGIIADGNPGAWDVPVDHRTFLAVRGAPSGQKEIVEEFWTHVDGWMEYEH